MEITATKKTHKKPLSSLESFTLANEKYELLFSLNVLLTINWPSFIRGYVVINYDINFPPPSAALKRSSFSDD